MRSPALDGPPERPPFVLRGRLLTPLDDGGIRWEPDGVVAVDARGRIEASGPYRAWQEHRRGAGPPSEDHDPPVVDLRPWLLLPGLVDLHAHLPQVPHAGLGSGMHLLDWLERYIYPLERDFDAAAAASLAPAAFAAFAGAGSTTVVLYGAAWQPSLEVAFATAEAHGIRAVMGRVMMDRVSYRGGPVEGRLELELRESAELCERWDGRDGGRLRYAYTPRFGVACSRELLRESATLAASSGAFWQTHLSEDRDELAEVARLFPDARDYLDVYERAGGLGPRAILAHAIHLSEREVIRLAESGSRVAHCPESNLFLASGAMRLARYRSEGIVCGLGTDLAGGPSFSVFSAMRAGAYTAHLVRAAEERGPRAPRDVVVGPLDWLRLGTLDGALALGMADRIGSLEPGKEADLIAVDHALTAPVPGLDAAEPEELVGRLIFRPHPAMVRAAWVRGRRLPTSVPWDRDPAHVSGPVLPAQSGPSGPRRPA